MRQLLCKGVQKLLGEWLFKAALLPNQNFLPCVRYIHAGGKLWVSYVGGKFWVSTNHVRYRKNVNFYFLFKYSLVRRRWGVQSRFKDKQDNDRYIFIMSER